MGTLTVELTCGVLESENRRLVPHRLCQWLRAQHPLKSRSQCCRQRVVDCLWALLSGSVLPPGSASLQGTRVCLPGWSSIFLQALKAEGVRVSQRKLKPKPWTNFFLITSRTKFLGVGAGWAETSYPSLVPQAGLPQLELRKWQAASDRTSDLTCHVLKPWSLDHRPMRSKGPFKEVTGRRGGLQGTEGPQLLPYPVSVFRVRFLCLMVPP